VFFREKYRRFVTFKKEIYMVKSARFFLSAILLFGYCAQAWAQDTKAILDTAIKTVGAENLRTLHYSAAGSIFDDKGHQTTVNSYEREMDLNATTSSVKLTLMQGTPPAPQTVNQTISATSPWNVQFDFWLTPFGFLKGATSNAASSETKNVDGGTYKIVTFTLPGNHKIVGYINTDNFVERVEARTDDNVLIQAFYHDYQKFGSLEAPTVMIQRRGGSLSQILIMQEAKSNS
jgi:hypothetical protein